MKTVLTDQEPVLELMPVRGAGEITLGEWLEDWLEYVIRPNREDTTYYGYQSIVRNHAIPAMGRVPLAQLDPMRIQAYYSWLRMEKRLSANTVHKHHILLHTALKTAFRQGLLEENPVDRVEAPRQAPPRQSYYDSAQLRALLRAARGHRLELVIRLAASLGLRRSEICGLRWENVDLEGEIIYVRDVLTTAGGSVVAKQPKTPHSIRKLGVAGLEGSAGPAAEGADAPEGVRHEPGGLGGQRLRDRTGERGTHFSQSGLLRFSPASWRRRACRL